MIALGTGSPFIQRMHGSLNMFSLINAGVAVVLGALTASTSVGLFVVGPVLWVVVKLALSAIINMRVRSPCSCVQSCSRLEL